jgi:hypothetical protein
MDDVPTTDHGKTTSRIIAEPAPGGESEIE